MSQNDEIRTLLQKRRAKQQHRDEQGKFAKKSVDEVARQLGLDTSDIRVRVLATRDDIQDVEKEVMRLAVQMHHHVPTDADRASPVSRVNFPDRNEQLWGEYRKGSQGLYGLDLLRFKQRMREKGLRDLY